MDAEERIKQFEGLVESDPDNDMALFSLAGAYNQAGRFADAAAGYLRCIDLNPGFSKAYQLAGAALMAAQDTAKAGEVLTTGYEVAAKQGDLMPKDAMGDLLRQLALPVPEVEADASEPSGGDFKCQRTGRMGTRLESPPFRGPIGAWIQDNISAETFRDWIGLGTKLINELRLDLSQDQHEAAYDYGMRLYLGLSDELYQELTGKAPADPGGEYRGVLEQVIARAGQLEEFQGEMHKNVGN